MSFIRVPPDGAGKRVHTQSHNVEGVDVETQVMHLADPIDPTHKLSVNASGAASVTFAEGQPILTGFGALMTSNQRALGVYESSQDSYDDLFTVSETGGTSTYVSSQSAHVLAVDGVSGSDVSRTTNRYHYYLPGSSNLVMMTVATGDAGKTGNRRRWGAFDDNDGVFFELDETTLKVVVRSSVSGSVVETKVAQSAWNNDKVDGTGLSTFNVDVTKINVWWIDYQWLGGGRVRFGVFSPDGERVVCHSFENAGAYPVAYMRTGTLPLRTQNVNHATTGSTSELREQCLAIYTEGNIQDYTFWRKADIDVTSASVTASETQLFSVRAKPTIAGKYNAVQAYPEALNIHTDQPLVITIWQNTDVTAGSWSIVTDSSLDANTDGTVDYGNAIKFLKVFLPAGTHHYDLHEYFEMNDEGIMMTPAGPEIWTISAKSLGTTATVTANLCHRELW